MWIYFYFNRIQGLSGPKKIRKEFSHLEVDSAAENYQGTFSIDELDATFAAIFFYRGTSSLFLSTLKISTNSQNALYFHGVNPDEVTDAIKFSCSYVVGVNGIRQQFIALSFD